MASSSGGPLCEYNIWYNHSVLAAVRFAGQDGTQVGYLPELYEDARSEKYNFKFFHHLRNYIQFSKF
jgi:hypothetical protein